MLAWVAPLLVFGLVIFVHELGHFLAAKWAGVYTPRFSIGFGPALWRRRRGETEYIIASIPLGGYVRMASKEDQSTAFIEGGAEKDPAAPSSDTPGDWDPEAMIPFGPKPIPAERWFESKPLWKRLVIMLAGVTMNALLAWVITVGTYAAYGRAHLAPVVDSVAAGRPAEAAGFRRGDTLLAIDGAPIASWPAAVEHIAGRPGEQLTVDVARGERVRLVVTAQADTATNLITGRTERIGRIGLVPRLEIERIPVGPLEAVTSGTQATVAMGSLVITVLRGLLTGNVGLENLGGPIRIAQVSVEAGRVGIEPVLRLIALISINLAVLNLLPIPILDGGHIVIQLAEAARGRPFGDRTREWIMRFGLALIALLIITVMYNDIRALVGALLGRGF